MRRHLTFFVALLAIWLSLPAAAVSADDKLTFLGESYGVAFRKADAGHHAIIELLRSGEDLKSWKKLLGLHRFR